ncbi:formate/nitrite transporter family protein [Silicimonas algicola]|uniref:Formate/nitrite transporter FocA (FNT family) n=1 Tax=Silicimonas algicola TaxID=1826607 RepID=A0A316GA37_9RHOB|nr:formate/nitrite transporter family protein [Silicimonas algicola]PWK57065.1 formate/nitrite transporter FocA (FNT family) [Silicimonas algicola]
MLKNKEIRDASGLNARMIYEVIRREGDEELERPKSSLAWSGVAAGLLISFSVLGEAILRTNLADLPARYLIENLGYSFGFLLVILGRMQLFTENTITTIFPLVALKSMRCLLRVLRLWSIVLVANVVGAAIAAAFIAYSHAFSPEIIAAVSDLSHHATGFSPLAAMARAIPAGILVAAIVWMLPGRTGNEVVIIILFTWLIAAGDFTHIIAGSVEMWFLILNGELGLADATFRFFLPVLFGNVLGGSAVFAMLAWGQVHLEVEDKVAQKAV